MFRKLITAIATGSAAVALMVAPVGAANAAPDTLDRKATVQVADPIATVDRLAYTRKEQGFLDAVKRNASPSAYAWSDAQLLSAGRYACQRKAVYRLGAQIGAVRTRIIAQVERDVSAAKFRGGYAYLSKIVVRYTGYNPIAMPAGGLC